MKTIHLLSSDYCSQATVTRGQQMHILKTVQAVDISCWIQTMEEWSMHSQGHSQRHFLVFYILPLARASALPSRSQTVVGHGRH